MSLKAHHTRPTVEVKIKGLSSKRERKSFLCENSLLVDVKEKVGQKNYRQNMLEYDICLDHFCRKTKTNILKCLPLYVISKNFKEYHALP